MPNVKKLRTLLVLLFISLWWGATGPADLYGQKKPNPLVVSYSALVASQSYLWIAKKAGYFERNGLDVRMVFISSGAHNVAALLAGDVDIGIIGGMGVMRAKLGGADLYLIGGTKNQYAGSIVAQPQIKTPAELKGEANCDYSSRLKSRVHGQGGAAALWREPRSGRYLYTSRRSAGNRRRSPQRRSGGGVDHSAP